MRVRQFVRKGKTRVFFTMGEVDVFNRYSLISFFFFLRARKIIFLIFLRTLRLVDKFEESVIRNVDFFSRI